MIQNLNQRTHNNLLKTILKQKLKINLPEALLLIRKFLLQLQKLKIHHPKMISPLNNHPKDRTFTLHKNTLLVERTHLLKDLTLRNKLKLLRLHLHQRNNLLLQKRWKSKEKLLKFKSKLHQLQENILELLL